MTHLDLFDAERDLLLAARFELTITYVEDDEMFFGARPPELRR